MKQRILNLIAKYQPKQFIQMNEFNEIERHNKFISKLEVY